MTTLEQVKEFHLKFGHPVSEEPIWTRHPNKFIEQLIMLRIKLIDEELGELSDSMEWWMEDVDGMSKEDIAKKDAEVLDALCDLQVVLDGAFLALGYHHLKDKAFAEVMRSNMSKLGADGKPIYREDGKILKGPNYTPPNLVQFFTK